MAITAQTKVPTLDYWKLAGKLQVGDWVFDKDGNPVQIKLIQSYRAKECFEVILDDNLTLCGDKNLTLPVENLKHRHRQSTYKGVNKFRRPLKPTKVLDLVDKPLVLKNNRKAFSIPTTKPLQYPTQDFPVPPFIFGFWFFARRFDGTMSAAPGKQDEVEQIFKDYGYLPKFSRLLPKGTRTFRCTPTIESQLIPNIPNTIPNNYVMGSVEQRMDLLRGIFSTKSKSYNKKQDFFQFSSKNFTLVQKVQCVAESLGMRTNVNKHDILGHYTVKFKSRLPLVNDQVSPPIKVNQARRYIVKINPIEEQQCVHIETTAQDNTILVGEGYIPTC